MVKLILLTPLLTTWAIVFSAGFARTPLSFQSNQQARKSLPSPPLTVTANETFALPVQLPPPRTTPSSEASSASVVKPESAVQFVPNRIAPRPLCQATP